MRALVAFACAVAILGGVGACNLVLGIEVAPLAPTDADAADDGGSDGDACSQDAGCAAESG